MTHMENFDVVIVGSGFGGAIPAEKLSRAGLKVCLLERGPWRKDDSGVIESQVPGIYARPLPIGLNKLHYLLRGIHHPWFSRLFKKLNASGLFEIFISKDVNVVCSSSLGGGSHVYGGLHAKPLAKNYWDAVSGELSTEAMNIHYDYVQEKFNSKAAPEKESETVFRQIDSLLDEIPVTEQPKWAYQHFANEKDWYNEADLDAEGPFGSKNGRKTTLDRIFIAPAIKNYHLQVKDLCEVVWIETTGSGYKVSCQDHSNGQSCVISADRVILAAGCVNTVRLLMSNCSKGLLPEIKNLGKNFSANADVMAFWLVNRPSNRLGSSGPYKKLYKPKSSTEKFVILQTGVFGLKGLPLPDFMKTWLEKQSCLASIGEDSANGEITLEKHQLNIHYQESENSVYPVIRNLFAKLAETSQTKIFSAKKLTTVHPMGGAVISDIPEEGVVNPQGEVHASPGLFVTDASVFPRALGAPPSWNVAAWASHVSDHIINSRKESNENP